MGCAVPNGIRSVNKIIFINDKNKYTLYKHFYLKILFTEAW